MSTEGNSPLALVQRAVTDNERQIGRAATLKERRDDLREMLQKIQRWLDEVDEQYLPKRALLEEVADKLNKKLASKARHPSSVDQRELLEALLVMLLEFDGYDEDGVGAIRDHVTQLMAVVVEGAPALVLTDLGWAGTTVAADVWLEWFKPEATSVGVWQLVIGLADGEEPIQHTIPLETCDDDPRVRLADRGIHIGTAAIVEFLADHVVPPHATTELELLRQALINAGLNGDLCNNVVGL